MGDPTSTINSPLLRLLMLLRPEKLLSMMPLENPLLLVCTKPELKLRSMPPPRPRLPKLLWLIFSPPEKLPTRLLRKLDKLKPSRPIRLTSSTLRNTMLTSKPEPLRKSKLPTMPGRRDTVPKRDSQLILRERPGLPTCQTTLLMNQISTKDHQLLSRKCSLMPRRPKLLLMPPLSHQLPSFNSQEETRNSPKREPKNLQNPPNHLDLTLPHPLLVPAAANERKKLKKIEYQLQKLLRFLIENLYLRNLSKIYFHNITV